MKLAPRFKRVLPALFLLVVASVACTHLFSSRPRRANVDAQPFAGCWELTASAFKPQIELHGDEQFIDLPTALQLLPTSGVDGWQQEGLALQVPSDARVGSLPTGYWFPTGKSRLFARLTNGFTSLAFSLTLKAGELRGTVQPTWDFPRHRQSAEVTARRRTCPAPLFP